MNPPVHQPIPGLSVFSQLINSSFDVRRDGFEVGQFRLVDAQDLYSDDRSHSFSLLFHASPTINPKQGIYELNGPDLGPLEIFLVPIEHTENGLIFEASFNLVT